VTSKRAEHTDVILNDVTCIYNFCYNLELYIFPESFVNTFRRFCATLSIRFVHFNKVVATEVSRTKSAIQTAMPMPTNFRHTEVWRTRGPIVRTFLASTPLPRKKTMARISTINTEMNSPTCTNSERSKKTPKGWNTGNTKNAKRVEHRYLIVYRSSQHVIALYLYLHLHFIAMEHER
jgi:hypothetical protein